MEKILQFIFDRARAYCRDETDLVHITTALEMAKKLVSKEGGDKGIILPAIIMHDLGWHIFSQEEELKARRVTLKLEEVRLTHKHEVEGAILAEKILSEINYPEGQKKQIIEIIVAHDTRTDAISKEDMIVKDADRLSRYTPECFPMFALKFKKTQEEFFDLLKSCIEKWLFTDSAKFLAREYLLKRRLGVPEVESKGELRSKFYELLIKLEAETVKITEKHFEKIAIVTAKEKVYDVKKMVELYLANRSYIDITQLQKDEEFCSIATQNVCEGGYIGVIDRETGMIIFHPDKKVLNLPPQELKREQRPAEYLHGFWDWHNRARKGEEFYSFYQGMSTKGEITDKFQYAVPINIGNAKWALILAAPYEEFFKTIDILNREIMQSVGEVTEQIGKVTMLVETRTKELAEFNKQLQLEITEHKQTQKRLIEAERLGAVAQIASEIAHEIKNPLAVVKAGLYYLTQVLPEEQVKARKNLLQMDKAIERATSYINDLLNFSKPSLLKTIVVDVNQLIEESIKELPPQILTSLKIVKDFDACLPKIEADPQRLKQVFINIIKNASESMAGQGRLKIANRKGQIGEKGFVQITFEDNGGGIPKKYLKNIFDPFFTTKDKGTGLGLAVCQRIIEAHKGKIEVTSEVGKGTTVIIKMKV